MPNAKEMPSSPVTQCDRAELLGSLTTLQQQRTSARVIKKLQLDDADRERKELPEGEPQKLKPEEKDASKLIGVKQRTPKALWSTDEKNLFFEALNEYGKDFDSITAYIRAKMKKKGVVDMLKTKNQVSHFYYRTWHKLSKHVRFDENVKKVAQELYALINFGELRRKLSSVNEKTCARLEELVCTGSLVVRARGRNVRLRTPMCRALRRLNQITEVGSYPRVCSVCCVTLKARDLSAWSRVQSRAHNPRLKTALSPRVPLHTFIQALQARWSVDSNKKPHLSMEYSEKSDFENHEETDERNDIETERMILEEKRTCMRCVLHVGPSASAQIHIPVLIATEQLSSQKICFSSYLERTKGKQPMTKNRTPKRHRKDSSTDKEHIEKKQKLDGKPIDIDETAVDGIELMASYKSCMEDDVNPSTEDDLKIEFNEEAEDRDNQYNMSEREKDSLSDLEEKSDSDSDHGKKSPKFNNLKVKFRIRPKKCGGSVYTMMVDPELSPERQIKDEQPNENKIEELVKNDIKPQDETINKTEPIIEESVEDNKSKDAEGKESKLNDTETKITDASSKVNDPKLTETKTNEITDKTGNNTKAIDHKVVETKIQEINEKSDSKEVKIEDKPQDEKENEKCEIDIELATRQIRKGWSAQDCGELTIGDLYLMFGSRSKIELDYWWAEPTLPIPQPITAHKKSPITSDLEKTPPIERKIDKLDKTPEKGTDYDDDKRERESDTDIFSPKNVFGQDSNDALSGDERRGEPKYSSCSGTLVLASKLINRPDPVNDSQSKLNYVTDRLKRLLALAGNPTVVSPQVSGPNKCNCGHVCTQKRMPNDDPTQIIKIVQDSTLEQNRFRNPIPIAPKAGSTAVRPLSLSCLPQRRRGRNGGERSVVVQRLLPLLPKLPKQNNDLIPVKIAPKQPTAPKLPKLLPKPPSLPNESVYIISQLNGQFYIHDGDRRIPIIPTDDQEEDEFVLKEEDEPEINVELVQDDVKSPKGNAEEDKNKPETPDITSFLRSESCLSPSRLLREGWLETNDFSLSSFLGQLEGRTNSDLQVDSQLQSLMAESSVDYVAKFVDLAAEVTAETHDNGGDAGPSNT